MSIFNDISNTATYIVEHGEDMWKFAFNERGTTAESLLKSHVQLWNTDQRTAFQLAVKTAAVALVSAALAHLFVGKFLFTGLVTIAAASIAHTYNHYVYEHPENKAVSTALDYFGRAQQYVNRFFTATGN